MSETKVISKHYRAPGSSSVTALGCFLHNRRVVIIILPVIIIISVKCVGNTITIIIVVVCTLKSFYFSLKKLKPISINAFRDWDVKYWYLQSLRDVVWRLFKKSFLMKASINSRNKYDIYLNVTFIWNTISIQIFIFIKNAISIIILIILKLKIDLNTQYF